MIKEVNINISRWAEVCQELVKLQAELAEKDKAIKEAEDVINKLMFTIINYTDYPDYKIDCSKNWLEKYREK